MVKVLRTWPLQHINAIAEFPGLPGQPTKSNSPTFFFSRMTIVHSQSVQAIECPFTFCTELAVLLISVGFIWLLHFSGRRLPFALTVWLLSDDSGEPPNI